MASQIKSFWRSNNFICAEQHGFLWHRSSVSNLAACDTKIAEMLNEQNACDVFLLDFARAFNKVPYLVVLQKMRALRIGDHPCECLADFLRDRSQCVLYGGEASSLSPVLSGVIQGSLLGPTLFTGVINDLPSQLETCKMFLFADDGKAVGPARSTVDRDAVQRDLHTIGGWSYRNGLTLNMEKCVYLHYGSKNHSSNYVINDQPVQNADSSADLGVIRTCNFRYNDHVKQICLKASRLAGMVFKLFSSKDIHFLTQVFITYVRPLTEYAYVIWNPADVSS